MKPTLRKEIRELSNLQFQRYTDAINALHFRSEPGKLTRYEQFAKKHVENADYAHGKSAFLPWHRRFIREYELELQKIDPRVTLPYWDWSLDSKEPHTSPIFTTKYMGGNGNSDMDWCVTDGPFAGWQMQYPEPHCLKRSFNNGTSIRSFAFPEQLVTALNERRFSIFSRKLELYHGSPHNGIGAYPGDFAPLHSPNDPIFFLHHTFIDLLWWHWQQKHPESANYDGIKYKKTVSNRDMLAPFNISAESTFDTLHPYYCYEYPEYPRRITALGGNSMVRGGRTIKPPTKGTNLLSSPLKSKTMDELLRELSDSGTKSRSFGGNLLKAKANNSTFKSKAAEVQLLAPLPQSWLEQNGFTQEEADEEYSKANKLALLLATIPDYEPFNSF